MPAYIQAILLKRAPAQRAAPAPAGRGEGVGGRRRWLAFAAGACVLDILHLLRVKHGMYDYLNIRYSP